MSPTLAHWFARLALLILVGTLLAGCIIRTSPRCRTTHCWWEHGRKVCAQRYR